VFFARFAAIELLDLLRSRRRRSVIVVGVEHFAADVAVLAGIDVAATLISVIALCFVFGDLDGQCANDSLGGFLHEGKTIIERRAIDDAWWNVSASQRQDRVETGGTGKVHQIGARGHEHQGGDEEYRAKHQVYPDLLVLVDKCLLGVVRQVNQKRTDEPGDRDEEEAEFLQTRPVSDFAKEGRLEKLPCERHAQAKQREPADESSGAPKGIGKFHRSCHP
jgi:hypothetical protein